MWKDTRYIGVATAKNKDWFITVARYSPRGNVVGQFRDNVPALGKLVKHSSIFYRIVDRTFLTDICMSVLIYFLVSSHLTGGAIAKDEMKSHDGRFLLKFANKKRQIRIPQ